MKLQMNYLKTNSSFDTRQRFNEENLDKIWKLSHSNKKIQLKLI